MIPFIHIGPLRVGTYGIFLYLGSIAGLFVLLRDVRFRKLPDSSYLTIMIVVPAGIMGAKLWHCLERPAALWADPGILFQAEGFAFFGGLAAGAITLAVWAHAYRIPVLQMLDMASPPATIGYGIGRLGCFVSGDGCYGIPTQMPWGMAFPHGFVPTMQHVHPTPLYEAVVASGIFYLLWRLRRRAQDGLVFSVYLILSGCARFLVEFLRANPPVVFGLSNAQLASLVSILLGCGLYLALRRIRSAQQLQSARARAASE